MKKIIIFIFSILLISFAYAFDTSNLEMYHTLDGNFLDISGNNIDGTDLGTAVSNVGCILNDCFKFDHDDGGIDISGLVIASGTDMSINLWANVTLYAGVGDSDEIFDSQTGRFIWGFDSGLVNEVWTYDGAIDSYGSQPALNEWHMMSLIWDKGANTVKVYQDCNLLATANSVIDLAIGGTTVYASRYVDEGGFWRGHQGLVDEISIWSRQLTVGGGSECVELYNSGNGFNPTILATTFDINTNLINNTNSTDNPFNFNVNLTINNTNDIGNIEFWVNSVLEINLSNINLSQNHNLNFSDGNGAYLFNITAYNNESALDSITRDVFIDTIQPKITELVLVNNSVFEQGFDSVVIKINFSDTNLEAINHTLYKLNASGSRIQIVNKTFVSGITTSQYIFNFTDDLSNSVWEIGNYESVRSALDGHTKKELRYTPYKNSIAKEIYYGELKFYCENVATIDYDIELDRISPKVVFRNIAKEQICYYETDGEFTKVKRQDPKLSMWYVDLKKHFWIDEKHKDIEVEVITPQKLKIIYTFVNATNYLKVQTFGDLNFNELSLFFSLDKFTSYRAKDILIGDNIINSVDFELISNTTINFSTTRELFIKSSFNAEKTTGGGTNILFGNITIDGEEIKTQVLRTITAVGTVGAIGFDIANFSRGTGSYNLEIWLSRTGNGNVFIDNFDLTLLNFDVFNTENTCDVLFVNETEIHSGIGFSQISNFSNLNNYESEYFIQNKKTVSASGLDVVSYEWEDFDDGEVSTIVQRFLSNSNDVGSMFNVYIDIGLAINRTFILLGSTDNGETITCINSVLGFCLRTENNTKINHFTENNLVNNTYNVGESLLLKDSLILKNGTALFVESSISFGSFTGLQTPNFFINSSSGCRSDKERTLSSALDIGNVFFTLVCNDIARNDNVTVTLYTDVEVGETIEILNNSMVLTAFEVIELDTSTNNLAPEITLIDDIDLNLTNGVDTTITIQGLDPNGDNISITVNWSVNGVIKKSETLTIVSGGSQIFVLSSGFYTTGQIVNASGIGTDGSLESNIVFTSNVVVQEALTLDTLILINISNQLAESLNNQELSRGDNSMLWLMVIAGVFLIIGIWLKTYLLWVISATFIILSAFNLQSFIANQSTTFYIGGTIIVFIIGLMVGIMGVVFQMLGLGKEKPKDFYDMEY